MPHKRTDTTITRRHPVTIPPKNTAIYICFYSGRVILYIEILFLNQCRPCRLLRRWTSRPCRFIAGGCIRVFLLIRKSGSAFIPFCMEYFFCPFSDNLHRFPDPFCCWFQIITYEPFSTVLSLVRFMRMSRFPPGRFLQRLFFSDMCP